MYETNALISNILNQLDQLSKSLDLEVIKSEHQPMGGGYLGQIHLEGIKNNFSVKIRIDLDFLQEIDAVILKVNPLKEQKYNINILEAIKESIIESKNDFYSSFENNWIELLSKEIKIRTEMYN